MLRPIRLLTGQPRHPLRATMSTFNLPNSSPSIPVSLPTDITQDQLLSFPAFKNWLQSLQKNLQLQETDHDHGFHDSPYTLRRIDVQVVDWFGTSPKKRLGFVKMQARLENRAGETLPGSVFLRGPSVAMMVILQPDDVPEGSEEEKHVLLTIQPRVAAASMAFVEVPAGMVDDSGTFAGAAAKEIEEELGMSIPASELINLTELAISESSGQEALPQGVFPSPGGCDEYISTFLHEKRVPREQLKEWTGKLTGLRDQGEKIALKLVRLEELWRVAARDGKTASAWGLYAGLKGEGKI